MKKQMQKIDFYEELKNIARKIDAHEPEESILRKIHSFDRDFLRLLPQDETLLYYSFLDALFTKVNQKAGIEQHFLRKYNVPPINLSDLFVQSYPPVALIQQFTNETITDVFRTTGKGVLIDLGIGTGFQVTRLIRMLKADAPYLKELTVVGIEPDAAVLAQAAAEISSLSGEDLRIRFVPVNKLVETLNLDRFRKDYNLVDKTLVVNASFSLHHIGAFEDRLVLFQKIRKMNPDLFILSEPDSDHYTPDFYQRFKNSFNHFKTVFRLIDTLYLSAEEKKALKLYFNREIADILTGPGRVEKHSSTSLWLELMAMTGFHPQKYRFSEEFASNSGLQANWYSRGYWGFDFESKTIASVLAMK